MGMYRITMGEVAKEMVMGCLTDEQFDYWQLQDPNRFEHHVISPIPGEVSEKYYIGPWHECDDIFHLYATEFNHDSYLKIEELLDNGKTTMLVDVCLDDRKFLESMFTVHDGHYISTQTLDNRTIRNVFFGESVSVGTTVSSTFETEVFNLKDLEFSIHTVEGEEFIEPIMMKGSPIINQLIDRKTMSYCFMLNSFKRSA